MFNGRFGNISIAIMPMATDAAMAEKIYAVESAYCWRTPEPSSLDCFNVEIALAMSRSAAVVVGSEMLDRRSIATSRSFSSLSLSSLAFDNCTPRLVDLFREGGFQLSRGEEVRLVQLAYTGERSINGRRFDRLRSEKFK
jgi:hypothetical protein